METCGKLWDHGKITASENGRFFSHTDGTPFFWLADTAWLIFARLRVEDAEIYLEDRRRKGFNVAQAMLMNVFPQENVFGEKACGSFSDFARASAEVRAPDSGGGPEGYWGHVDRILEIAERKGIYLALVPVWGDIVKKGFLSQENAAAYGRWLGRRYRAKPHVIWLIGGDIRGDAHREVWTSLARAIRAEDQNHLMSFHPFGRTKSSTWFHAEPWLDFNMFQSGHRRYGQTGSASSSIGPDPNAEIYGEDNWRYVEEDLALSPPKPTLDGEPSYEGIPQGLHDPNEPYWTDADARRYAYWSVFAGAAGHTFGNNAIMQMHKPEFGEGSYGVLKTWREALNDPGAGQMRHLKDLILSFPYFERIPAQETLLENGTRYGRIQATRGEDWILAYSCSGGAIRIRSGAIQGEKLRAIWIDPKTGERSEIRSVANSCELEFRSPAPGGADWVLSLYDSGKPYLDC